ncbi:1,2-phenylacetyl-CoA epoxidase, subunit E [wastewater metagenome]|uniref:1,2-phenylacetyl-CoA epoxidase, subunit E n=2 Tax=unclassified sequences TaxID=12908 RepID=A0A5B8R4Y9_9ZZZZ|nr:MULTISPECIES: 1,2-phenylacetyl-CoA epoxidase subunit PaaE [Arhodomonas]MCS4502728.1 phenylacetate-CoA oxygenase/reductase subunit PaaK [Arhodomonas aquaeolei]QEA03789.1 1,2-phenylacetyl-CoA epoxidase, subunit E [uncultured organism]
MSRFHELTVTDVRQETRDTVSIRFDVPETLRETYRYAPGQHLALRTWIDGEEVMRTYSICTGVQDEELRVAIKTQPHGRFSSFANSELRPGDRLEVMPPQGHFNTAFDPANRKHYLAIAAGSGITPIMSLARTALHTEPGSRVTLIYGNRSTASMIFREQIEDLKNAYMGRFNLINIMSRERTDIDLFHGRIDGDKLEALFRQWIDIDDVDEAFICGPEPMIHAASESLKAHDMAAERVHFELFTTPGEVKQRQQERANDTNADHSSSEIAVRVDGQEIVFDLARNTQPILEAGLEAGADLPFSCKGGVCSTCRAKVVEGDVEMDVNYALEDYEIEAGYVLSCQSYPVSDRVVLDYDE